MKKEARGLTRIARRLLIASLWLSLLVLPGWVSGVQFPASNFQFPVSARAFAAPTGHAIAWLTPGPAPELWLAAGDEAPRLVLTGESEHFSAAVWSPDGRRVAVLTVPTGTETAALGRWLILNVASQTVTVESAPVWAAAQLPASSSQPPASSFQLPISNL